MYRTFFERFGHIGIAVLPATVLSDDQLLDPDTGARLPSLREQISRVAGISHSPLCYARAFASCGDGLYWAEIAATQDFVNASRIILTEEDLYAALPWDNRLQGKGSGDILAAMAAHAQAVRPAPRLAPESPALEMLPVCPEPVQPQEPKATTLIPLPELYVSVETVAEATHEPSEPFPPTLPAHPTAWARLIWLRAALAMVRRQMQHARQTFTKLDVLLDKVLSAQKQMRQPLVSASPVQIGNRLVGWRLQIALPLTEVLA